MQIRIGRQKTSELEDDLTARVTRFARSGFRFTALTPPERWSSNEGCAAQRSARFSAPKTPAWLAWKPAQRRTIGRANSPTTQIVFRNASTAPAPDDFKSTIPGLQLTRRNAWRRGLNRRASFSRIQEVNQSTSAQTTKKPTYL